MATQQRAEKSQKEGRILLAKQAYQLGHISSIKDATRAYNIPYTILQNRLRGRGARAETRANCHKLTEGEEDVLEEWILSMDNRGFSPSVRAVKDTVIKLL